MTTLTEIEQQTKALADARESLARVVRELNDQLDKIKRSRMRAITNRIDATAAEHTQLKTLLQSAPELFQRPRTVVFSGIKVGYQKSKGGLSWDDDARVIALIEKHLPDQAETLVATKRKPIKAALAQLNAVDLKRLGVRVADDGDQVVINPQDSEIDKLVTALTKAAVDENDEAGDE